MLAKRLLITGGTGFFGKAILRHFLAEHFLSGRLPYNYNEVIAVSRNPSRFQQEYPTLSNAPWLKLERGDVTDTVSMGHLVHLGNIHSVLHAATDSVSKADVDHGELAHQIVSGTHNVLKLAASLDAKKFLFTSSGAVYGQQPTYLKQMPENYVGTIDQMCDANSYALGKKLAEHLCKLHQKQIGMSITIARCFAFVGQDLPKNAHFAIGNFIRDALEKERITILGDGRSVRSYMDQRDLSKWLFSILNFGRPGQAYNVGSDKPVTIFELATLIRDTLAPDKEIVIKNTLNSVAPRSVYVPSVEKAVSELGLQVSVKLAEAISNTAAAYK